MPPPVSKHTAPLALVCGEDDFAVKQRAKQIYLEWTEALGGMDHEIIDAAVSHSGEALKVLAKLREGLQTLPFFGSGKVIWLKNCNFLSDERAATKDVTESLAALAEELKGFSWQNVRLLISAGKVDKRKVFYKALDKLGTVESFAGWSVDDRDWEDQAEAWARKGLRARQKEISDEALAERGGLAIRAIDWSTSATGRRSSSRTSPRSARVTRLLALLPWATPWVIAICPGCWPDWTRPCGR